MSSYYIASCVFTSKFPILSARVQDYITSRWQMPIVRCCVPRYRIKDFEAQMPEGPLRDRWASLPDSGDFSPGSVTYSLCHNCINIVEELHAETKNKSLWELILSDDTFPYPTAYRGREVTVQDCWRSRHRSEEQAAVREIAEETGITGRVLRHLATIDYWFAGDDHRVHKVVHHFLLEATGGDLTTENDPDHEAEDVAWVDLEDVSRRLAYPNERRIVAAAREILVGDG